MAQLVFVNAKVLINSVDLSDHVRTATVSAGAKMLNDNAMADTFESSVAGLQTWKIDVEFIQDYASAKVDATLFPLIGAAAFTVAVNPVNAANSATNPAYSGSAVLSSYDAIGGKHGDLLMSKASFASAGLLSRLVA